MRKKLFYGTVVLLCLVLLNSAESIGATDTQGGLPQALFPGVTYASIATESEKPTSEAPAVISVITAEDLHNHGITSLEQALEEVPGVYSPFRFLNGNFVFRGIRPSAITNPEVLLLVDGVPQNDFFLGVLQKFITRIPIANIKRIEIIRGPGSVVHGSDAFAGVINIITKTDQDYDSSEVRGRAGSYNTAELDGVVKGKLFNIKSLLSIQARTTDGHEPLIAEDTQTYFDNLFGTDISLAPDKAKTFFDEANVALDLFTERWRTRFQVRKHTLGAGTSLIGALYDTGDAGLQIYNTDIFYSDPDWLENWRIKAKANIQYSTDNHFNTQFLPAGAVGGLFPEGVMWEGDFKERKEILEIKLFYHGHIGHELVMGAGYIDTGIFDTIDLRNYQLSPNGELIPTGNINDLPRSQRSFPGASRQIKYINVNDDWNLVRDVIVSLGARYDSYSDSGDTLNPRLALIWLTAHNLTTKIIMNRAFRAPTMSEQHFNNKILFDGNPNLKPAIIRTYELAIEKKYFDNSQTNVNVYHHILSDFIETESTANGTLRPTNSDDEITGNGFEIETINTIKEDVTFKSSYSYQVNKSNGNVTYSAAPHHKVYAGIDWQFRRNWNLYTNILWVNGFTRAPADPRDDIGDSSFVGTVLRYTSPTKRWDSYLSIRNIFDEEAVSPSDDYRFLPNDYPLPGTNLMAEIRYYM